jgi:hypothetical protein
MLNSLLTSLSTSLRIGLSKNGITLLRLSGWRQRKQQMLADELLSTEDSLTPQRIAAQIGKLIKESGCEGLPVEVIVSEAWVRNFIVTPPKNCSRLEDCRAAANMRFQTLYGEGLGNWYVEADWDPQYPFLSCALPQTLRSVLLQVANEHHLTLTSIVPHFIASWNRWHSQIMSNSWFGLVHENNLTLGIVNAQRLCGVRTVSISEDTWNDPQWFSDHVLREALRLNVPATTSLQLCGEVPGQWTTKTFGTLHCMRLDSMLKTPSQTGQSTSLTLASLGLLQ